MNTLLATAFVASPTMEGISAVLDPGTLVYLLVGVIVGLLVGAFPGVSSTMAIALASGFTFTLEPVQGLAVLITIYVSAQFGDRLPAILMNTPGTPASISTTFDGYPLALKGKAGLAMTSTALGSAIGLFCGIIILVVAAVPLARFSQQFGPPEMFALVLFGLTMMVGVSQGRIIKGLIAGIFGLLLAVVGRDPMSGEQRFVFDVLELNAGVPFIPVIIGLFGVAEVFNQILIRTKKSTPPVTEFGTWWPSRALAKRLVRPVAIGSATGSVIGLVPAVGGDIAGVIGWENSRKTSKRKDEYGKGSVEGLVAGDTSSAATLGGSLTTTMALGVPGDSVMAVMIGSMMIWGLQPGPMMFANEPSLLASLATIMVLATVVALIASLLRLRGMAKLMLLPKPYIWTIILIFCMIGTYSVNNSVFDVAVMFVFGFVGLFMVRFGIPAGPAVLGLILGPLAEANLRRALISGGLETIYTSPIAIVLILIAGTTVVAPIIRRSLGKRSALTQVSGATPTKQPSSTV